MNIPESQDDEDNTAVELLESISDAFVIIDESSTVTYMNRAAERVLSRSRAEVIGNPWFETIEPARGTAIEAQVQDVLCTRCPTAFEAMLSTATGPRWFEFRVYPHAGGLAIYFLDTTDRKRTAEALKASELQLQCVIESALDAIVAVNSKGRITLFNESAEELFQYTRDEALGQEVRILLRDTIAEKHQAVVERFLGRGVGKCGHIGRRAEKHFQRKDGSVFMGEASLSAGRSNGERLVVVTIHDITGRKRADAEIQRQLREKELIVREVHHRIKNQIASIGTLLNLQARSVSDPEAKAALQDSIARVSTMQLLYNKLLISANCNEIEIDEYLEPLAATILSMFPNRDRVTLECTIDGFTIDNRTLFSIGVITNELFTNIMKHTVGSAAEAGDEVRVQFRVTKDRSQITLCIRDDGIGLPDGFDPGTDGGFGLMLVTMLSEQLDGTFSMQTRDGFTTRIVTVPTSRGQLDTER